MKGRLAATGIHVGRKVAVEGQEIIEFIAESEGRAEMVGQVRTWELSTQTMKCKESISITIYGSFSCLLIQLQEIFVIMKGL